MLYGQFLYNYGKYQTAIRQTTTSAQVSQKTKVFSVDIAPMWTDAVVAPSTWLDKRAQVK
jgi:hypothetical protein